eukprot:3375339-Rhodomonas_salina.3
MSASGDWYVSRQIGSQATFTLTSEYGPWYNSSQQQPTRLSVSCYELLAVLTQMYGATSPCSTARAYAPTRCPVLTGGVWCYQWSVRCTTGSVLETAAFFRSRCATAGTGIAHVATDTAYDATLLFYATTLRDVRGTDLAYDATRSQRWDWYKRAVFLA